MAPSWLEKFIVRTDASPDPLLSSSTPVLEIHYTALSPSRAILGCNGDTTPRYLATCASGKVHVTSPLHDGRDVATLDFKHGLKNYTEIVFEDNGNGKKGLRLEIPSTKPAFTHEHLGALHWKATGMKVRGAASWELRDGADVMVLSVAVDETQVNGLLRVWRAGLGEDEIRDVVVVGIAKVEEYRDMLRKSRMAGVGAGVNAGVAGWLVGGWA